MLMAQAMSFSWLIHGCSCSSVCRLCLLDLLLWYCEYTQYVHNAVIALNLINVLDIYDLSFVIMQIVCFNVETRNQWRLMLNALFLAPLHFRDNDISDVRKKHNDFPYPMDTDIAARF